MTTPILQPVEPPSKSLKPKPERKTKPRNKWIPKNPRERRKLMFSVGLAAALLLIICALVGGLTTTYNMVISWLAPANVPTLAMTEIPTKTPEPISITVTETENPPAMESTPPSPTSTSTLEPTHTPTVFVESTATQVYDRNTWTLIQANSFQLNGLCFSDEGVENWHIWVAEEEGGYVEGCESAQEVNLIRRLNVVPRNMAIRPTRVELPSVKTGDRSPVEKSNFDWSLDPERDGIKGFVMVCAINADQKVKGKYITSRHIVVVRETISFDPAEYESADLDICYYVRENKVRQTVLYFISSGYQWILEHKASSAGYYIKTPNDPDTNEVFEGLWFGDLPTAVFPPEDNLFD